MVGAEIAVGYVFAWLVRKARHAGQRADGQVDAALDAGVDRLGGKLHDLVAGRLGGDTSLERLGAEAARELEAPSERTAQRVALALQDAAEDDPEFGAAVEDLVRQLQDAHRASGSVSAADGGVAVGGDVKTTARDHGVAVGILHGNLNIGNPPVPGTGQA